MVGCYLFLSLLVGWLVGWLVDWLASEGSKWIVHKALEVESDVFHLTSKGDEGEGGNHNVSSETERGDNYFTYDIVTLCGHSLQKK